MPQFHTGALCPVCKRGTIVAEVDSVATVSMREMPIGPGSTNYYATKITSFHCELCQVLFHHPPGQPNASSEILEKIRVEQENARNTQLSAKDRRRIDKLLRSDPKIKKILNRKKGR